MTTFRGRMIAAAALIIVVFIAMVAYTLRVAPQMSRDSSAALDNFYRLCRARDYAAAHAMMSANLQPSLTASQLKTEWTKFAAKNGDLARWEAANKVSINAFGGSVCVFPPFVEYRHAAFGQKGTGTLIYVRMVPESGKWKLERFNVLRARGLT